MQEKTITLILTSDPTAGTENVSVDGSYFTVDFQEHIIIPHNATTCSLEMHTATIWWNMHNISASLANNQLYYTRNGVANNITIPDGLYSITDLNTMINRLVFDQTGQNNLFTFSANPTLGRVEVAFKEAGLAIDYSNLVNVNIMGTLGFAALRWYPDINPPHESTGFTISTADYEPSLRPVDYFLVQCDLASEGIVANRQMSQTIGKVPIVVPTNTQIIYEPNNALRINADDLIGQRITRVACWITDSVGNRVNTHGKPFSITLVIRYNV